MPKLTYCYFDYQDFTQYFPAKQSNATDREKSSLGLIFCVPPGNNWRKILFKSLKEITQVYKATCHWKRSCWWQKLVMIVAVPLPKRVYSPSSKTTGGITFYSVFLLCNYTCLLEKWSVDWHPCNDGRTPQSRRYHQLLTPQGTKAAPSPQGWARCGMPGHASHYEAFNVSTCAWSSFLYSSVSFPAYFLLTHFPSTTLEQLLHTMRNGSVTLLFMTFCNGSIAWH